MNIEEIRKNKPEGATNYTPHSSLYGRVNSSGFVEVARFKGDKWNELPLKLEETVLKPIN